MERLVFLSILLLSACIDSVTENQLQGSWSATGIRSNDTLEKIDLSVIKLQMNGSDFVYFKSRKEVFRGKFSLNGHLLTLMPTSGPDTVHVQIGATLVGSDTLMLRMNRNGKEMQLFMVRDSL